jgi:hypothetical protein
MARNFNYAAPGAHVGVQADNVVIAGGLIIGADGVRFGQDTTPEEDTTPAIEEGQ